MVNYDYLPNSDTDNHLDTCNRIIYQCNVNDSLYCGQQCLFIVCEPCSNDRIYGHCNDSGRLYFNSQYDCNGESKPGDCSWKYTGYSMYKRSAHTIGGNTCWRKLERHWGIRDQFCTTVNSRRKLYAYVHVYQCVWMYINGNEEDCRQGLP